MVLTPIPRCQSYNNELPVKDCKLDSATHGTKNMIANRLMAVSERSLIGKSGVYTENNNESRIEGSNPSVPMWLDSYQLAGNWQMPCKDKNSCKCCLVVKP